MLNKDIPLIKAEKTPQRNVLLDTKGFFIIQVFKNHIRVEYYTNVYKKNKIVSGKIKKVFSGKKANALCDTIVKHIPGLRSEHYAYLGRELQRAEDALKSGKKYIQDGC